MDAETKAVDHSMDLTDVGSFEAIGLDIGGSGALTGLCELRPVQYPFGPVTDEIVENDDHVLAAPRYPDRELSSWRLEVVGISLSVFFQVTSGFDSS